MNDMVSAAQSKGIREIAITDHYDPDYPDPNFPFIINFEKYHKAITEAQKIFKGKIKVLRGVEIGIQHGNTLQKCKTAAKAYDYDFILGSFHSTLGQDLYSAYFDHRSVEEGTETYYAYMYDCLRQFNDYDVIGHFNVIDRYASYVADYRPYMDIIEAILKLIITNGKGIEINTSSFRYNMGGVTTPSEAIFKLYQSLGGEIVTIGSDAHYAKHLGYMYDWAVEFMKHNRFRYLTTFEGRKPSFVKL